MTKNFFNKIISEFCKCSSLQLLHIFILGYIYLYIYIKYLPTFSKLPLKVQLILDIIYFIISIK